MQVLRLLRGGHLGPMQGDYALLEIIAVGGLIYFATFDAPLKRLEMDLSSENMNQQLSTSEEKSV